MTRAHDRDQEVVVEFAGEEPVVAWPMWWRARLERRRTDGQSPWLLLAVVLTGLFATGFSVTILAVSLPELADDLGASTSVLTLAVTGPFLALALAMPVLGKIGDVRGHRRVYLVGLGGFAVATAATALAWDAASLIGLRVVAATAGAATAPASMAMIMHAFAPPERTKAMGWWSLVGAGAPVTGLVVGGPMVDALGWRTIFVVQAPLAALAVLAGVLVLPETRRSADAPIDWLGAGLLATTTVAALGVLQFGGEIGWTHPILVVPVVVAVGALVAFVRVERRAATPLIPPALVRRRNFRASITSQWFSNFGYMGGYIVTPVLVQRMFGFSVGEASLAMAVRPLMFSIAAPIAGYVAVRIGERRCAFGGSSLLVLAMGLFLGAAVWESIPLVFAGLAIGGISQGIAVPSLVTLAANDAEAADLGVANAAQQMVAQIGAVAGIQAMSTIAATGGTDGFVVAYAVGAGAALLGTGAAGLVRGGRRTGALTVARAA